jgi:hypothetical protein
MLWRPWKAYESIGRTDTLMPTKSGKLIVRQSGKQILLR